MLSRLLGRLRRPATDETTSPQAPAPAAPAAPAAPTASSDSAERTATPAAWHLVARRPLIDRRGAIAGWDLRLSDRALQRLVRAGTPRAVQETYAFALLRAVEETAQGGRVPLVTLAGAGTADTVLPSLAAGAILVLGDGSGNVATTLALPREAVRAAGVKLAAPAEAARLLDADYGLLDGARLGAAEVLRRCQQPCPAPGGWIATNLGSFDDVVAAVQHGVQLACGRFAEGSAPAQRAAVPAAAVRVASIITALAEGRAPRDLAELIKADVTLSHRLLRHLSMAGVGQGRVPQSIQDAVMLLGTRELHRWLCVLLADAGTSPISTALHETALTRGRLLELIALSQREPSAEPLFVLGAFSLLDLLLGVPLQSALALTPLPAPVLDALLRGSGTWWPYLEIALAIEAGDSERLDAACAQLGLTRDTVLALHGQASQWSQEVTRVDG